jgi:4-diphosphocytidyl-2-C-methyl-D-erythritol kinase
MDGKTLIVQSPAKVNLRLEIVGRRADGYHLLRMINCDLELCDELELDERSSGITMECDHPDLPTDSSNLVWRAAEALAKATGCGRGVAISLKKLIPVAAGLGGGSSNAAAVLRSLNALWNLDLSEDKLMKIGLTLGADVPYFLHGGPALVEGIGEILTPFSLEIEAEIVLVNPGFPVSTKAVYEAHDWTLTRKSMHTMFPRLICTLGDFSRVLLNDLEPIVSEKHPEISGMKAMLHEHGALGSLMSGSGPTVFGIFQDADAIDGVMSDCALRGWRAIRTRLVTDTKQ